MVLSTDNQTYEVFIIGGAQIYELFLPFIDRLYIRMIDDSPPADTFFPEYEHLFRKVVHEKTGIDNGFSYTFQILEK